MRQMNPLPGEERVVAIDTLRGVALAGVLIVNLLMGFRVPLSAHILHADAPSGSGGALILSVVAGVIEFKAFTLFSFLFGVGVAIQAERAAARGASFLLRRFGALLGFGLIHLLLIWNGDILTLYAICGILLIPLLMLPAWTLAVSGLLLIAAPYVVSLPVAFPSHATLTQLAASALPIYQTGTWRQLLAFRWQETVSLIFPLLALSLPRTVGLMLWGVAAWRYGLRERNARVMLWIIAMGAALALAGRMIRNEEMETVPLAAVYGAGILLWNPYAPWIAAAGRMALTNYLTQSIVFGLVFYSYGLGWFGRWGVGVTLAGGMALYCAQLWLSQWWMKRFYFGPFEWLWRSISYRKWQPLWRENAHTVSLAASGQE